MRGCRLLYFVKSKSGTKCKNFAVLLCFYVNTFISTGTKLTFTVPGNLPETWHSGPLYVKVSFPFAG